MSHLSPDLTGFRKTYGRKLLGKLDSPGEVL